MRPTFMSQNRNQQRGRNASSGRVCSAIAFSTGQAEVLASGLGLPVGIWGDASYLYVTDQTVVRRITKATEKRSRLPAPSGRWARLTVLHCSAIPNLSESGVTNLLYVADVWDYTIRRIRISTSEVTTLAGSSEQRGYVDARGPSRTLPWSKTSVSGEDRICTSQIRPPSERSHWQPVRDPFTGFQGICGVTAILVCPF